MANEHWGLYKLKSPETDQGIRVRYWVHESSPGNPTLYVDLHRKDYTRSVSLRSPGPYRDPPHRSAYAPMSRFVSFKNLYERCTPEEQAAYLPTYG